MRTAEVSSQLTDIGQIVASRQSKSKYTVFLLKIKRLLVDKHYLYVCQLDKEQRPRSMPQGIQEEGESSSVNQIHEAYDFIVTDERNIAKWTLSPKLNSLVQMHNIYEGCTLTVDDYNVYFDEKIEGGGPGIVLINSVQIANVSFDSEQKLKNWSKLFQSQLYDLEKKPLTGSREYYCPVWDDDNFESFEQLKTVRVEVMKHRKPLSYIIQSNSSSSAIIGRVHKKSKLNHFGKSNLMQEFPFFFSLLLVDGSLQYGLPVTIWNRLALDYYADINVGDILVIIDYRIKKCYDANLFVLAPDQTAYDREISVNSQKELNIFKIAEDVAQFAPLNFNIASISALHFIPDKSNVTIAGLVVKIGPYERGRLTSFENTKNLDVKFAQFRYITLIDGTSKKKLNCKIYTNSRKNRMDIIQVGQIVLLTDLTVYSVAPSARIGQREFMLQSSFATSIFTEAELLSMGHLLKQEILDTIKDLEQFIDDYADSLEIFSREKSNIFSIPHIKIDTYPLYKDFFPKHEWHFFEEIFSLSQQLQYTETRTIVVQAYINVLNAFKERKRKRADNVSTKSKKKQKNNDIELHAAIPSSEEEVDMVPVDYDQDSSHLSLTVILEDINNRSSIKTILNLWKLQNFHPFSEQDKFTDIVSMRSLLFQFFRQPEPATRDKRNADTLFLELSQSVSNKLFICCVQMIRTAPNQVDYLLTQSFPAANSRVSQ